MFHQADNLYFSRLEDGSVRILKLKSTPVLTTARCMNDPTDETTNIEFHVTIPANHWASIIATCSRTGEAHYNPDTKQHKWYAAVDFHNS